MRRDPSLAGRAHTHGMGVAPIPSRLLGGSFLTGARADSRSAAPRASVGDVEARQSRPTSKGQQGHRSPLPLCEGVSCVQAAHWAVRLARSRPRPRCVLPRSRRRRAWPRRDGFPVAGRDSGVRLGRERRAPVGALVVERVGEVDQAAHDPGGADEARHAGGVAPEAAQERAQADQVEEAQLAEVDDARRRLLARARKLGLGRPTVFKSNSPISLSPTRPDSPSLRTTTSGEACWCALMPDSDRVRARLGANAYRGKGGRRSVGELGSIRPTLPARARWEIVGRVRCACACLARASTEELVRPARRLGRLRRSRAGRGRADDRRNVVMKDGGVAPTAPRCGIPHSSSILFALAGVSASST